MKTAPTAPMMRAFALTMIRVLGLIMEGLFAAIMGRLFAEAASLALHPPQGSEPRSAETYGSGREGIRDTLSGRGSG